LALGGKRPTGKRADKNNKKRRRRKRINRVSVKKTQGQEVSTRKKKRVIKKDRASFSKLHNTAETSKKKGGEKGLGPGGGLLKSEKSKKTEKKSVNGTGRSQRIARGTEKGRKPEKIRRECKQRTKPLLRHGRAWFRGKGENGGKRSGRRRVTKKTERCPQKIHFEENRPNKAMVTRDSKREEETNRRSLKRTPEQEYGILTHEGDGGEGGKEVCCRDDRQRKQQKNSVIPWWVTK